MQSKVSDAHAHTHARTHARTKVIFFFSINTHLHDPHAKARSRFYRTSSDCFFSFTCIHPCTQTTNNPHPTETARDYVSSSTNTPGVHVRVRAPYSRACTHQTQPPRASRCNSPCATCSFPLRREQISRQSTIIAQGFSHGFASSARAFLARSLARSRARAGA